MVWYTVMLLLYELCCGVCVCDSEFEYIGYNLNVVDRIEQWIVNSNSAYQKKPILRSM